MVADDVQMETPPVIRPPRRKKLLSLKGFKNLKTHLGLNLGTALVPEISFAAVPNHPKPVLSHSRIAKAVFSATWAGQSILCDALLQDGDVCSVKQETERKQTLKEIEDEISDPGYETIPVRSTIEEDVFEIANDNLSMGNDGENSYECHESSFETAADITELKTVTSSHKSVDHLYSVPNKRPIKVKHNLTSPQARSQIDVLETLKLMKAKQSESSFEIRKKSEIKRPLTWQSESNITLDRPSTETIQEFCKSKQPISASKRVEFMENLHMKLELLRKEVLDTVEENKSYQKQKLLWAEKINEANQILEENMVLKDDIRHLEQTVDESRQEVQKLKQELLRLKDVTNQVNTQSNELVDENSNLKQRCYHLQRDNENTISLHQHNIIINEIKMLLENLKLKYQAEIDHLYSQIGNNRQEFSQMKVELLKYKEQSTQLKSDNASLNSGLEETLQKCQQLLTQLKASHQWGETAQDLLATLIHVAEHTAEERDELVEKARAQTQLHQKFVSVLLKRTVSLGRLQESVKGFKIRTVERVQKMEELVEETEEESKSAQISLEMEIEMLKEALLDRDEKLRTLILSKKKLENDLESMWEKESSLNMGKN